MTQRYTPSGARVEHNIAVNTAGKVRCVKCRVVKSLSEYPHARKNNRGQPRYAYCKPCHSGYQRELRLAKLYNITAVEYDKLLAFQDGACWICQHPPKRVRLAVDHDHKTGLIRGLLCAWCNRAIGQFRDNTERVRRVLQYFEDPPATKCLGSPRFGVIGRVTNKLKTRVNLQRKAQNGKDKAAA